MREIGDWFGLLSVPEGRRVVVLGVPLDTGVSGRTGAAGAPRAIREWTATAEAVDEAGRRVLGLAVEDAGDVVGGREEVEAVAVRTLAADTRLLSLGGDHSVTPPLFRAVASAHPDCGLVMLDAHPDLFARYDGDPESHACVVAGLWRSGHLRPAQTAFVGLRSYAYEEIEPLSRAAAVVPASEWLHVGAEAVAERIRTALGTRPVYVSLDIDVLDPACAPGTGYPIAGGPDSRALLDLMRALWSRLDVVAMDLVEVAPSLDPGGVTVATAAHVLLQVLGWWASRPDRAAP